MLQQKPVKKLTKQQQNMKDATTGNGVNSRPVFKGPNSGPRAKTTLGGAKNGKSFPDLNKDGKITKADILKGRGVIAKKGATVKKAKSGASVKKCKYGCK